MPAPLARLLSSSRFWTAAGALAITIASVIGLDPAKATKVVTAVVTLAFAVIGSTSYEDAAANTVASDAAPISPPSTPAVVKVMLLLLIPAMLLSAGCSYLTPPAQSDLNADRATYDAIAPEYDHYIHADPAMPAEQVARRERTLATWQMRVGRTASTRPSALGN